MNNYHYLLRDTNEIFGIYTKLDIAYNYLLQILYTFYRYHKMIEKRSCNIELIIKNFQIIEYDDNMVINLYNINNDFKLIDIHSNIFNSSTISIIDFISKLENMININDINIDSNELNLFIPINFIDTDIYKDDEKKNTLPNDINLELIELQTKIDLLAKMKDNEEKSLEKIKDNTKVKEEQVFMEQIKNEKIKQKLEQKKEYYEKSKNKFKIDKNLYFKIKEEIKNNQREEYNLPELFIEEFQIFTKLEENNMLNRLSDEEFEDYLKYKPEKKQNFKTLYDDIFNNNWSESSDSECSEDDKSINYVE